MPAIKKQLVLDTLGMALFILVILVIAVGLIPVFTFHRGSRIDSCQSNERQVGLAVLQYVQDYDVEFPCGLNKSGVGWAGTVQNYVKSTGVFHCPQDPTKPAGAAVPDSYAMNSNLRGVPLASLEDIQHTVTAFEIIGNQARLDLPDEGESIGATGFSAVGDGTEGSLRDGDAGAKYATGYMGKRPILSGLSQFDGPEGRHNGGSNFLMGDGHVKFLMPDRVSTGSDAKNKSDGQTGGIVGRASGTDNTTFDATFSTK